MTTGKLVGKRILIAKPGLDGHDVGAKIIVLALRDAGAEVIYTGLRKTSQFIARVAIDEDVDAVGLSLLSGSHEVLVAETIKALSEANGANVAVFVGGTIPAGDRAGLVAAGVRGIFTADMRIDNVIDIIARELCA
jgi:methylmalonyl-CoA mutase, C-terminal domain